MYIVASYFNFNFVCNQRQQYFMKKEEESVKIYFTNNEEQFMAESKRRQERIDTIYIKQAVQVGKRVPNANVATYAEAASRSSTECCLTML